MEGRKMIRMEETHGRRQRKLRHKGNERQGKK
jgi:hypothetical protein